jgi:hypothetical protein
MWSRIPNPVAGMIMESPPEAAPPAAIASPLFRSRQERNLRTALCRSQAIFSGLKSVLMRSCRSEESNGGLYDEDMRSEASISGSSGPGIHDMANGGLDVRGGLKVDIMSGVGVEKVWKGFLSSLRREDAVGVGNVLSWASDLPNTKGWIEEASRSLRRSAFLDEYPSGLMVSARPMIGTTLVSVESLLQNSMSPVVQSIQTISANL